MTDPDINKFRFTFHKDLGNTNLTLHKSSVELMLKSDSNLEPDQLI